MNPLTQMASWDVSRVAAAVVDPGGVLTCRGELLMPFPLTSVTKVLVGYAAMVAVEEGALELDEPVGRPGATVRHLLAHTAGYGFGAEAPVVAEPGARRVYSNRGFEILAAHLRRRTGIDMATYLSEAVLRPLGMRRTRLDGSPAWGATSTVEDLQRFAVELLAPRLLAAPTLAEMRAVQFPGLAGLLPGVGRFTPLDWGLGVERAFGRRGHWAGACLSRDAFGHFGRSGTFLWVDPTRSLACVCLTDRDFGPWALDAWPRLSDALLDAYAPRGTVAPESPERPTSSAH